MRRPFSSAWRPWWTAAGWRGSRCSASNKLAGPFLLWRCLKRRSFVPYFSLACRGGEEGVWDGAASFRSSHRWVAQVVVRCRNSKNTTSVAQVWPPNPRAEERLSRMRWMHPLFNLQAWRPFYGVTAAVHVFHIPSGLVPGEVGDGRRWLQIDGGSNSGPDCFSCFLSRVCAVNLKDCFVVSNSFRGPSVICKHSAVNECTA
jgi:hypothetical protein